MHGYYVQFLHIIQTHCAFVVVDHEKYCKVCLISQGNLPLTLLFTQASKDNF